MLRDSCSLSRWPGRAAGTVNTDNYTDMQEKLEAKLRDKTRRQQTSITTPDLRGSA